jgi:predicted phage terminase large subunit-like protein
VLETDGALWNLVDIPAIAETRQVFDLGLGQQYVRQPDELLEPDRMPRHYLNEMKSAIGTAAFNAQYQQRPVPAEGNLVLRSWFQDYNFDPRQCIPGLVIFQSWDLAMKTEEANDYSVCITFGVAGGDYLNGEIYILNVFRAKLIYPDLKKTVLQMYRDWRPRQVIIEDKGSGTGLIQDLKRDGIVRPIAYMPVGDKIARLSVQSAKIANVDECFCRCALSGRRSFWPKCWHSLMASTTIRSPRRQGS